MQQNTLKPQLQFLQNYALTWIIADKNLSDKIFRWACINCEKFPFDKDDTLVFYTAFSALNSDFKLICIKQKSNLLELYGLYGNDVFHPVDKKVNDDKEKEISTESDSLKLFCFLYEEDYNSNYAPLIHALNDFPSSVYYANYKPVLLPADDWKLLRKDDHIYGNIVQSVKSAATDANIFQLWEGNLSCLNEVRFIEILVKREDFYARQYLLAPKDNEQPDCFFINGTNVSIFNAWEVKGRTGFQLANAEQIRDYLKLFCWCIQADEGQFLLINDYKKLSFSDVPAELKIEDIKKLDYNFAIDETPAVNKNAKIVNRSSNALIIYDHSVSKVILTVNPDEGIVEMEDDKALITSIKLETEKFGSDKLLNWGLPSQFPGPDIEEEVSDKIYSSFKTFPDLPEKKTLEKKCTESEFFDAIVEKGHTAECKNLCISEYLFLSPENFKKIITDTDELLIDNCRFQKLVNLQSYFYDHNITFKNCVFEKGIKAESLHFKNSISFTNCFFSYDKESAFTEAVNFKFAGIEGNLTLDFCRINGSIIADNIILKGSFRFLGCQVSPGIIDRFLPLSVDDFSTSFLTDENLDRYFLSGIKKSYGTSLSIRGATIKGDFEITTDANYTCSFFNGAIAADTVHVSGRTSLCGAVIVGSIDFSNSNFEGDCFFSNSSQASLGLFKLKILDGGLNFTAAKFILTLNFICLEVDYTLSLYGIYCGKSVAFTGSKINMKLSKALEDENVGLIMDFAEIRGFCYAALNYDNEIKKPAELNALTVNGDLRLFNCKIDYLKLKGILVRGSVRIIAGEFNAVNFSLGWAYKAGKIEINTTVLESLFIESTKVQTDIFLTGLNLQGGQSAPQENFLDNRSIKPGQDVSYCKINSCKIQGSINLFCEDKIDELYEEALSKGIDVKTSPEEIISVVKTLEIIGSEIGNSLDLRNLKVISFIILTAVKIKLDLNIDSSIRFKRNEDPLVFVSTSCEGISMEKAEVGGDVKLSGLKVTADKISLNEKYDYLRGNFIANGSFIKGSLLFLEKDAIKLITKEYENYNDKSKQQTYGGKDGQNKSIRKAVIAGTIELTGVCADEMIIHNWNFDNFSEESTQKRLYLDRGKFNKLVILKPTPVVDLGNINVSRWSFEKEKTADNDIDNYIHILSKMDPFDKSVYINVERMLRNESSEDDANRIYRAMQKRAIKEKWVQNHESFFKKSFSWLWNDSLTALYNLFTDFGTSRKRPFFLWLCMLVFTFLILLSVKNIELRQNNNNIVVTQNDSALTVSPYNVLYNEKKSGNVLSQNRRKYNLVKFSRQQISPFEWDWKDALLLACRYCIPFVESATEDDWTASSEIKGYIYSLTLLSYIFLTITLYGLADKAFRKI